MDDYRGFAKHERSTAEALAPAERVWQEIESLGGTQGWYYLDGFWQLCGAIDGFLGGVGMRRDLERPKPLAVGGIVDFYRIAAIEPYRRLTLDVELNIPGRGVLEFHLVEQPAGHTRIEIDGYFQPSGLLGLAYWNASLPVHRLLFKGLARAIAQRAESL